MYTIENESLSAIADGIRKKTGKTDKLQFPAGFVSAIESIETGSGAAPAKIEEKDVNFFDYDGTLIASYTVEEAKTLSALPEPPEHAGLVFQQWNWSLDDVHTITEFADIGALYTTDDGATRLKIEVIDAARGDISLNFYQSVKTGTVIDWGDGGEPEASGDALMCQMQHTYANAGIYIISMKPADNCTLRLGQSVSSPIIGGVTTFNRVSPALLLEAYVGDRVTALDEGAFSNYYSLRVVSMNSSLKQIKDSAFTSCKSLICMVLPESILGISATTFKDCSALKCLPAGRKFYSIGSYACSQCASLKRLNTIDVNSIGTSIFSDSGITQAVFNSVSTINSSMLKSSKNLISVKITSNIYSIKGYAFYDCNTLKTVDLSHCTAVPKLENVNAFSNTPNDLEILVPAALADEWKQATNWTTLASKIKGV